MHRLLLIFSAALLPAQIHVHATPESLSTNILGMRNVGTWNVGISNMTQCPATISYNMLMTALPRLHPINADRGKQLITQAYNGTKRSKVIHAIGFIAPLAVAIVGGQYFNMTTEAALKATAATSLFATTAQAYGAYLQSQQPNTSFLAPNVPDMLRLAPFGQDGFSPTFTLISSKIKNADTMDSDIFYPVACPPPKPIALEMPPFSALLLINLSTTLWGF